MKLNLQEKFFESFIINIILGAGYRPHQVATKETVQEAVEEVTTTLRLEHPRVTMYMQFEDYDRLDELVTKIVMNYLLPFNNEGR